VDRADSYGLSLSHRFRGVRCSRNDARRHSWSCNNLPTHCTSRRTYNVPECIICALCCALD